MPDHGTELEDPQLCQLSHDLRECLHSIGMGAQMLQNVREDVERFTQICEAIDKERKTAQKLVCELIDAASRGNPRAQ